MYNEKTLYVDGNFSLKQVRTTQSQVGISSNSSLMNCEFYGAAEYNEKYADFETFDGDAFVVVKENNENYGNAYYVRDGLTFNKFYNYFDKTTSDLKKECKTDNKSDLRYLGNLKEQLPYSVLRAFRAQPRFYFKKSDEMNKLVAALLTGENNEAVKNILHGYIKGISELLAITRTEGNAISEITGGKAIYTLDIAKTYVNYFDKISDLVNLYYKSSKLTVGELFDSKEFKALTSPLLKNIDAKDVFDVLHIIDPYTESISFSKYDDALILQIGNSFIDFDKPGNETLEEYFKKVVLETKVPNGYATIKIKDLRVSTLSGDSEENFLPHKDSNGKVIYPGDDVLEEIEETKNEILDTIKTAKVSFTLESKKITRIRIEIDTIVKSSNDGDDDYNYGGNGSGGSYSGGSNYGGSDRNSNGSDYGNSGGNDRYTSSMNYNTTLKTTFALDVSLEKKTPVLVDIPSRYLNYI